MDGKGENRSHISLIVRSIGFVGIFATCSVADMRQALIVCAPFFVVLVPGYLEMLPEGGIKHGFSCDCAEPDERCELRFWFDIWQRLSLLIPVLWSSIFLYYYLNFGIDRAVVESTFAVGLMVCYSAVFMLLVLVLVSARPR